MTGFCTIGTAVMKELIIYLFDHEINNIAFHKHNYEDKNQPLTIDSSRPESLWHFYKN